MILDLTLTEDAKAKRMMQDQAPWDPPQAVKDRTAQVMSDFQSADVIRNKPYAEFNFNSLNDRIALDQTSWNQYPGERSKDPMESWKSLAFRPIVRNKIISIAAHITANTIYPKVFAQNENDEEDRDAAMVMRDLIEWSGEQSGYDKTFLYTVIAALVNPAAFIHTEYREVYRDVKELGGKDGEWKVRKVVDERFSGFVDTMVPVDEMWISNVYVHDVQRQPFLIWRRVLDYTTAKQKYGALEPFKFVKPGLQFLYSNLYNLFYQMYDESMRGSLVEEVVYYNRLQDLELRFVNGILMDDPDRPIQRQDKDYPFVKAGYELFDDGRFFYYKSAAFKMANDEEIVNTAYRMVVDGTYLSIMPPSVVFGNETVGTSVIAPGAVTTIDNVMNPNASFQTIATNNNLQAGYSLLEKVEGSISESTTDILQSSGQVKSDTTAFEASKVDQNARVLLGLFGKMIGFMVQDYGRLRVGDILQHMTVGEVSDLLAPGQMLRYRKFLLPEKTVDGKKKTRRIEFDGRLPDEGTDEEFMGISAGIAGEQRNLDDSAHIVKVNPALFRSLRFKCVCKPEAVTPKSDALERAMQLEEYDRAILNPLIAQNPANLEAVTRDLLLGSYDRTRDDPDAYLKPAPQQQQAAPGGIPQAPGNPASAVLGPQPQSMGKIAKAL